MPDEVEVLKAKIAKLEHENAKLRVKRIPKKNHCWNTKYVPDPKYNGIISMLEFTCVKCGQKKYKCSESVPECTRRWVDDPQASTADPE